MSGSNNRPYALNKPATFTFNLLTFTYKFFIYDIFVPPGIKGLNVIYMRLFQCGHSQRPFVLNIFIYCQLNTKLQNSHPNAMSQSRPHNFSI